MGYIETIRNHISETSCHDCGADIRDTKKLFKVYDNYVYCKRCLDEIEQRSRFILKNIANKAGSRFILKCIANKTVIKL
jgi:hypothetical protein